MKALVKAKAEAGLWLQDVPEPKPGPGEVLIRVLRTGICGTDLHIDSWNEWAQHTIHPPLVVGHEFVGEVVELGEGVASVYPGEIVGAEGHITCGKCRNCLAGRRVLCAHTVGIGVQRDGAFAELIVMPAGNLWPHLTKIDLDVASIFDPFGNAVHTATQYRLVAEDVLITGAGPIGLVTMKVALALGATDISMTDVSPQRLEVAKRQGATRIVNVTQESLAHADIGADVLIECSGNQAALLEGIRSLRPAGRAVAVGGGPAEEVSVPMSFLQNREITLTGTFRYANTYEDAIALVVAGRIDLQSLITGYYPLHEAEKALQATRSDPANIKSVVVP